MSDNIKVMVRIRPASQKEKTEGGRTCVAVNETDSKLISLDGTPKPRNFAYDWAGGPSTSQQEVFNFIGRQMVDTCLTGRQQFSRLQLYYFRLRSDRRRQDLHYAGKIRRGQRHDSE